MSVDLTKRTTTTTGQSGNTPPNKPQLDPRSQRIAELGSVLKDAQKLNLSSQEFKNATDFPYIGQNILFSACHNLANSGLQLEFDDIGPKLVIFSQPSPTQKYNFYRGDHLDKIYRKTEQIFKAHNITINNFLEQWEAKQNMDLKEFKLLLKTIANERIFLKLAIFSTDSVYNKFIEELSTLEWIKFYIKKDYFDKYSCAPFNPPAFPTIPDELKKKLKELSAQDATSSPIPFSDYPSLIALEIFYNLGDFS